MAGRTAGTKWAEVPHRLFIAVVAGYCAILLVLTLAGQRFSTSIAHHGWQFAPYDLLKRTPIRTALAMHVQPPLWNMTIGLIAHWSPLPDGLSFQMFMAALGLLVCLLATRLLLLVGLRGGPAAAFGLLIGVLPNSLQNVFGLGYELPTALLVLLLVTVLLDDHRPPARRLVAAALLATSLVLVRTLYHPLWLVAVVVGLGVANRHRVSRRTCVLMVVVPLTLVGAVMAKNEASVGSMSLTSWEGMNLLRSTQPAVPQAVLDRMVEDGKMSPVARIPAFSPYDVYEPWVAACKTSGTGLLDQPYADEPEISPFTGEPIDVVNYDYRCFVPVYQQAGRDAWTLITSNPARWFDARAVALRTWFTDYPGDTTVVGHLMDGAGRVSVPLLTPDTSDWSNRGDDLLITRPLSLLPSAEFLVLLAATGLAIRRRRRSHDVDRLDRLTFLAAFIYASTMVPGVLFELGEQARFRWCIEPLVHVTVVAIGARWWNDHRQSGLHAEPVDGATEARTS